MAEEIYLWLLELQFLGMVANIVFTGTSSLEHLDKCQVMFLFSGTAGLQLCTREVYGLGPYTGGGGRGVGVDDWNGIVNQLNVVLLPWELAQFVKTVLVLG